MNESFKRFITFAGIQNWLKLATALNPYSLLNYLINIPNIYLIMHLNILTINTDTLCQAFVLL